jgi:hypothetical protein
MARSAFAAGFKLLAFRWYTSWGATGAADKEGGKGRPRGAAHRQSATRQTLFLVIPDNPGASK